MRFTVAIDGPAASGKGTLARAVEDEFGFACLDTGLLYRVVAKKLLESGGEEGDEAAVRIARSLKPGRDFAPVLLTRKGPGSTTESKLVNPHWNPDLRTREVTLEASRVAALPEVREALKRFQREFARREGGAVLDGRDIGTVICPDAEAKLFVTADEAVRVRRRFRELSASGADVTEQGVREDLRSRDLRDAGRSCAALRRADDAVLLDTSELSIGQAVKKAFAVINERISAGRDSPSGSG